MLNLFHLQNARNDHFWIIWQVLRGMSVKQAVQAGNFEIRSLSSGTPAACIALTPGDENAASTVPYKDGQPL